MKLEDAGNFRLMIMAASLVKSNNPESQSIGIKFDFEVVEQLTLKVGADGKSANGWESIENPTDPIETSDRIWFVKKGGDVNTVSVEQLRDIFGWDGTIDDVSIDNFSVERVQAKVEIDKGTNGKSYANIKWYNDWDADPFARYGQKTVSEEDSKAAANRFGPSIRALMKNPNSVPAPEAEEPTKTPFD